MRECKQRLRLNFIVMIAIVLLLAGTFLQGCNARADKDDEAQGANNTASSAPASLSVQNGRIVLTLDAQSQKQLGLSTVSLTEGLVRKQMEVPAVVLSALELARLRNSYVAAQAQLGKSQANLEVASKEYERLKGLYQENQNASAKAMEAAEGAMKGDKADENATRQQLDSQESVVQQQWGPVVAQWIVGKAPLLEEVLAQRKMLVQITIPSEETLSPPVDISLRTSRENLEARFVSLYPQVDPRIQGRPYLYVTPARSGVIPGTNLIARFAAGKTMRGFVIPQSAVVWSEGQAWIYRQLAANQFSRFVAATDIPVEKGFLMTKGLSAGDRVVVRGAQTLLSEELLLQGQGASASDTDTD